ncbi:MAG TPA: restriction endonuclease subunit S [Bacteroidia bacterium]|jgi:type I restriction enzyme S subunit|nr:restriction endonuclease subunit S [Bacteroidia bacterium]
MITESQIQNNILKSKASWKTVRLNEVCEIDPSKRELNGVDKNMEVSFGMMADLGEHTRKFCPSETKKISEVTKGGYSYFRENDVLLAKMTPCFENGKSGLALNLKNGIGFGSTEFYVLRNTNKILPDFIYYIVSSDKFLGEGKHSLVGTTGRRRLLKQYVESYTFQLPPLKEQQQIASLFQSIESAIEQVEGQEGNLRKLCKSLIDEFVSNTPTFGNLLKGKILKQVTYTQATDKLMRKIDPVSYGIERIVAGENLQSEDFKIRDWGTVGKDFLGPAFHVLFKPGDILYGSRRTYLRKVALADFEGVCANTTYVIQANEKLLLQGLLKHIMLSERFTQYSISVSKGSTNPYINWKDLDDFTFQIPDIETQKIMVKVLDEILDLAEKSREQKETLKKLKQKLLNEILG